MNVPLKEAEGRLAELIGRVEAGEEIVLTRDGHPTARLVPARPALTAEERFARISAIADAAASEALAGPGAARSQDFLYDDQGLPE